MKTKMVKARSFKGLFTKSIFAILLMTLTATFAKAQKSFTVGQEVAVKVPNGKWYISKYEGKLGNNHKISYQTPGGGGGSGTVTDASILTMAEAKAQNITFENASKTSGGTASAAPASNPAQDKAALLGLINGYRKSVGSGVLVDDRALDKAAQDYANLLEQTGKTGHNVVMTTPNGKTCTEFTDRVAIAALALVNNDASKPFIFSYVNPDAFASNVHICNLKMGEILAYGQGTPAEALKAWQTSTTGHDGNMRNGDWTHAGIGISPRKLPDGKISGYNWVVVFGTPNKDNSTHISLDGMYKGKQFDTKYRYYSSFVKK